MEVNVCFDLGSDTLKVVFSYNNNGISYGKVVKNVYDDTAFPGTAFYDEVNKSGFLLMTLMIVVLNLILQLLKLKSY